MGKKKKNNSKKQNKSQRKRKEETKYMTTRVSVLEAQYSQTKFQEEFRENEIKDITEVIT